jgi:porin
LADDSAIFVVVSRVPKLVRPALAVPFTLTASAALGDAAPAGDFELAALLAAATQCQLVAEGQDADDECSGVALVQPEFAYLPTERSEFRVKLGLASSNALNSRTSLQFSPWAADLEDDVESVNGTGRDYLLAAHYAHKFVLGEHGALALTGGIIDATDFLDANRYANDEFTQFMSAGLVNGPNTFVPSYDAGGGFEYDRGRWSLNGVLMDVDDEDGSDSWFVGVQLGFHPETPWGPGTYRLVLTRTGKDFDNPAGTQGERRQDLIVSVDQQLGDTLGAFVRIEVQDDKAAITAESTWTAGLDVGGSAWGREGDNVGIGVGYADGGNLELRDGYGGEAYYRHRLNDVWALSGSVQYGFNDLQGPENAEVWTFGLRLVAEL